MSEEKKEIQEQNFESEKALETKQSFFSRLKEQTPA